MIGVSDKYSAGLGLLLEMALQTKRCVPIVQHSLVDRAVRRMARHATLAHGLMLKNKWPGLRSVALEAGFVLAQKSNAAAFERLLHISPAALNRHPDVRIMTIRATDFAFQNRVAMRQLETCAHLEMTLETCFR